MSYLSLDVEGTVPSVGSSLGEKNETVVAQGVRNDLKKGSLKKSNSRKRGTEGSIKGVQKSGGGKADKGVREPRWKSKDRHRCAHGTCYKVFSNASELR